MIDAIDKNGREWVVCVKETKRKLMFTIISDTGTRLHFIRYNCANQYYWTDENYKRVKRMRVRELFPHWRYW